MIFIGLMEKILRQVFNIVQIFYYTTVFCFLIKHIFRHKTPILSYLFFLHYCGRQVMSEIYTIVKQAVLVIINFNTRYTCIIRLVFTFIFSNKK